MSATLPQNRVPFSGLVVLFRKTWVPRLCLTTARFQSCRALRPRFPNWAENLDPFISDD